MPQWANVHSYRSVSFGSSFLVACTICSVSTSMCGQHHDVARNSHLAHRDVCGSRRGRGIVMRGGWATGHTKSGHTLYFSHIVPFITAYGFNSLKLIQNEFLNSIISVVDWLGRYDSVRVGRTGSIGQFRSRIGIFPNLIYLVIYNIIYISVHTTNWHMEVLEICVGWL